MVEKQVTCVILVGLHLTLSVSGGLDCLIEKFYQHCQVVLVLGLQTLLLFHLLVIKDIANVLIAEKVVRLAQ